MGFSANQLPVRADSSLSFVRISKGSWNRWYSSSCHGSARLPGHTIMQRCRSPQISSSLMSSPAMIVLPAPGSSARRKRSGCRGSISPYTAVIWCGKGSRCGWRGAGQIDEQVNPVRLRDQPEQLPVPVEAPRPPGLDDFEGRSSIPVQKHDAGFAGWVFVGKLDCC